MFSSLSLLVSSVFFGQALAAFDLGFKDDSDLTQFVTRPEIKAPIFNVSIYEPDQIAPGLWIVAPYAFIDQESHAKNYYQPCQTGPAIYDGNGDLVWSGACDVQNQNTCDLRVWTFNGAQYLSAILSSYPGGNDRKGHGLVMNASYQITQEVYTSTTINAFNMHELNLIQDGTKALYLLFEPMRMDLQQLQSDNPDLGFEVGWVADMGFREVDLETGNVEFEWWASRSRHVSLTESEVPLKDLNGPWPKAWNWFHGNSVEKNAEGDYMISSRYTNTIFKISGDDGHIIWRLGGTRSSFDQDFIFSRQHDARWLSLTPEKEVISFLDNAADEKTNTSTVSSALIVELDRKPAPGQTLKLARVVSRIHRPDGGLTRLRGNHQVLEGSKNHFICWSENAFFSEHNDKGQLLMEARFTSKRFVTYRAYKFNFTGMPIEPPTVKAFVYGTSADRATTVVYVSWNGATEVARWRFMAGGSEGLLLGEKEKTGFETSLQVDGYHTEISVEAVDKDGKTLGVSPTYFLDAPREWKSSQPSIMKGQHQDYESASVQHKDKGTVQKILPEFEGLAIHQVHASRARLEDVLTFHWIVYSGAVISLLIITVCLARRCMRKRSRIQRW